MQNAELWYALRAWLSIIGEADTFILHFAFIILHYINSRQRQELMLAVMSRMLFCILLSPFFRATSTFRMAYSTVA